MLQAFSSGLHKNMMIDKNEIFISREGLMTVLLESMVAVDFEDNMNTAQQLVENNITLYFFSDIGDFWKEELSKSPDPWHNKLAVTASVTKEPVDFFRMTKDALRDGTAAMMNYKLLPEQIRMGVQYNQGMGWHKSTEGVGNNPVKGYLTNKKWTLNEENKIMIFFDPI